MQLKRSTLIWLGLIALLMMGCQANTDTAGGNDANSSANAAQAISEAPTATPEPARPEPQPGPDSDGDWVSDADEEKFGTNPESWDTDEDGSTDFEEIFIVGSDPTTFEGDSDEDWLRDVTEELV
ncbi:MAG: hypothetical protein KC413_03320, partial [Anaerolineales bacterium]|nr:hypothetical protein [Anaerolineales bacterium]